MGNVISDVPVSKTYIYGLVDSRDKRIRYIGKTNRTIEERYSEHIKAPDKSQKYTQWIIPLLNSGNQLEIVLLDELENMTDEEIKNAELSWVYFGRVQGWKLFNVVGMKTDKYQNIKFSQIPTLKEHFTLTIRSKLRYLIWWWKQHKTSKGIGVIIGPSIAPIFFILMLWFDESTPLPSNLYELILMILLTIGLILYIPIRIWWASNSKIYGFSKGEYNDETII